MKRRRRRLVYVRVSLHKLAFPLPPPPQLSLVPRLGMGLADWSFFITGTLSWLRAQWVNFIPSAEGVTSLHTPPPPPPHPLPP